MDFFETFINSLVVTRFMVNPKEKLLPLIAEVNRKHINHYVNFLTQMQTPDDISSAMANSGESWGASYNQMFGPMMRILYNQNEAVRQAIHAEVRKLGISDDAIRSYFAYHIINGPIAVNMFMGNMIPDKKKKPFIDLTGQLMLDHLKSYAGIEKK